MIKAVIKYILVVLLTIGFLHFFAASLPFYQKLLADAEWVEQMETEKETNEKERLKSTEELTDEIPGTFSISFIASLLQKKRNDEIFQLQYVHADVPVPPPDHA